jgi:ABC-type nitrate/sulfonate/bicarbonate transport system substrate-binding protein
MNTRPIALIILIAIAILCATNTSGTLHAQTLTPPRVALSGSDNPASVPSLYGPITFGKDFGLPMTKDNFTTYESGALSAQAVISGAEDILASGFSAVLLLNQEGQQFKVFCLRAAKGENVLVGRNGITKIEQLLDPKTRVGIDSPSGTAGLILNAMLQANNLNVSSKDLKNVILLESAKLRQTAFVDNDIDATVLQLSQYRQLEKEVPGSGIISSLYEDVPLYFNTVYSAPAVWLDKNQDVAAAFCASVMKSQRAAMSDYNEFVKAINTIMAKPPSDESLMESWTIITQNDTWGLKSGISEEAVRFTTEIMLKSGTLNKMPNIADLLDLRAYNAALKLLGPYEAPADATQASDISSTEAATPSK